MGLDMYLYLKKTEHKTQFNWKDSEKCDYPSELRDFGNDILARNFKSMDVTTICQIGYWRKANAIHNWIVQKCADGVDECQEIHLSVEQMQTLKCVCDEVLKDHSRAPELLPTSEGFFFGSQEYDDWYFHDVEYASEILGKVIEFLKKQGNGNYDLRYEVIYEASW